MVTMCSVPVYSIIICCAFGSIVLLSPKNRGLIIPSLLSLLPALLYATFLKRLASYLVWICQFKGPRIFVTVPASS